MLDKELLQIFISVVDTKLFKTGIKKTPINKLLNFKNIQHEKITSNSFFVALSPKSTGMVMTGRLVHLTTLFPGQA